MKNRSDLEFIEKLKQEAADEINHYASHMTNVGLSKASGLGEQECGWIRKNRLEKLSLERLLMVYNRIKPFNEVSVYYGGRAMHRISPTNSALTVCGLGQEDVAILQTSDASHETLCGKCYGGKKP